MEPMKFSHLALLVLLGASCSQSPTMQPPAPTAEEAIRRAMEALGSKASVQVALNAHLSRSPEPSSDYSSTGLWTPPALLFVRSKAPQAKSPIHFVWIEGDEAWGYHEQLEMWVNTNELGHWGAATGIENPRDLIRILQPHLDDAIFSDGGLQLRVAGRDVRKILAPLVMMKIDRERSWMDLRFTIAEDGLLRGVAFKARLFQTANNVSEAIECVGELTLSVPEPGPEFVFRSNAGRIIPLSEDLNKRIASAGPKGAKEPLLLQAPLIQEDRRATVRVSNCIFLKTSQTGKYLLLGRESEVDVYTIPDLKLVQSLGVDATAAGFDEQDAHLVVVSQDLVRYDSATWTESSREPLAGAEFRRFPDLHRRRGQLMPRQALVQRDGSVLYRSQNGGLGQALWREGKLQEELVTPPPENPDLRITGVLETCPSTPLLSLEGGATGVLSHGKVADLSSSQDAFTGEVVGDVVVLVGLRQVNSYDPKTWKVQGGGWDLDRQKPRVRDLRGAAFDPKSGWVYLANTDGLQARNVKNFRMEARLAGFTGPCLGVAGDFSLRRLYTLEKGVLRSWTLKE
jgi:hypothetical protein